MLLCRQAALLDQFQVVRVQMPLDRHLLISGGAGPMAVVVKERFRFGNRDVVVLPEVLRAGLPVAVWSLVLIHQQERFVFIPLVLQPVHGNIRDNVRRVTGMWSCNWLAILTGGNHRRVVIRPLSLQHVVVVVALRSTS